VSEKYEIVTTKLFYDNKLFRDVMYKLVIET